jgi:hypothetical protein
MMLWTLLERSVQTLTGSALQHFEVNSLPPQLYPLTKHFSPAHASVRKSGCEQTFVVSDVFANKRYPSESQPCKMPSQTILLFNTN